VELDLTLLPTDVYKNTGVRNRIVEQNERLWYLMSCAVHIHADVNQTSAPYFHRYYEKFSWPHHSDHEACSMSSFNVQVQAARQGNLNVFSTMLAREKASSTLCISRNTCSSLVLRYERSKTLEQIWLVS
jgi:hypothetical protein